VLSDETALVLGVNPLLRCVIGTAIVVLWLLRRLLDKKRQHIRIWWHTLP